MKLTYDLICELTCGAVEVESSLGGVSFRRFTREQSDCYKRYRWPDLLAKTNSDSGVRIAMRTDAERVSFDYTLTAASSRQYGHFDIYENGVLVAHDGGEGKLFTQGRVDVALSEGEKTLEIYLPWSKAARISSFELGASFAEHVKRDGTLLCYGDSITQGYDAKFPSLTYVSRIARMLGVDEYNRGIGGDVFFPELLEPDDSVKPDIVTVAYGTNDWNILARDKFEADCRRFYELICKKYPDAKKYAITPIWRADFAKQTKFGCPHTLLEGIMRELLADLPLKIISGYSLTPHIPSFYSDEYLHPDDLGFGVYAESLAGELTWS